MNDAKRIRFLMIGGFLGAGKTTAIGRLAHHYTSLGRQVGLVTNDQAYDLVDTNSLRAQGFRVGEVPGACFCCKFDDLVSTVDKLSQKQIPDIIITEPVGSCTDLVATVIEPLRHLHGDRYEIGPLAVLLKPEHGMKILRRNENVGFSSQAAYIFTKQMEEADVVVINKIDKLTDENLQELFALVRQAYPDKRVLGVSARDGTEFTQLVDCLDESIESHDFFMDVDYDVYAAGEAELGWLNGTVRIDAPSGNPLPIDQLVIDVVARLRDTLLEQNAEPVHLKVLFQTKSANAALANLVSSDGTVDLSIQSGTSAHSGELIINARVATEPESLEDIVRAVVESLSKEKLFEYEIERIQRFRPARPVPTHRFGVS